MPKVSIIVPIYNVEKYLKECLNSLINQTLKDIEIICVNDGSTDSSTQILEEYKAIDNRIIVINKPNSGYGHTMNTGLEKASGDYVGIVESDDFVKKTMFEDLYNLAVKNNADVVKSDYTYYLGSKKQARKAGKISKWKSNKIIQAKNDTSILKIQPSIWSAIYNREFLNKHQIRFLETPGASYQDTSFAFKTTTLAERFFMTDKSYVFYRQDNESSSVHAKDKVFSICYEFDEIEDFLNKNPEIKKYALTETIIKQYKTYLWNATRLDESFRDEFIETFSNTFKRFFEKGDLTKDFYKKVEPKIINILINDKDSYRKYIDKKSMENIQKITRRKNFSIRINSTRISIILFGKQILEIS